MECPDFTPAPLGPNFTPNPSARPVDDPCEVHESSFDTSDERLNSLTEIEAPWSRSPPRPADEGDDGDAHEQHGADRHAGDDGGQGAVGSEHVVVKTAEDVANAHEGSDDGGAGERDGAALQLADAPNLRELRINLV